MKNIIPSVPEVGREAVIVLAGALLAALVIGQLPGVRAWIKRQWDGAQPPGAM
ncbi:hypothetical protein [Hydrogenophaga sp. PBC]|uniref:hypothetical protein n=1 Tax=Hydrogenophaga sp. PBC TaxID=795665 RepID=UPI0002607740|nr:hypothetical protein [Hydrogenophaga sp. PBC]